MAKYIEAEKAQEALISIGGCGAEADTWEDGWDKAINTAIEELEKIPAADVRTERHGYWIFQEPNANFCGVDGDFIDCVADDLGVSADKIKQIISLLHPWRCSRCGKLSRREKYCPKCGAKMDGKEDKVMGDNMKCLTELVGLLGEKNAERLQERIVDLICERVEDDLHNCSECVYSDEDFQDFYNECLEAAKEKVKNQIIEAIENKLLDAAKKM